MGDDGGYKRFGQLLYKPAPPDPRGYAKLWVKLHGRRPRLQHVPKHARLDAVLRAAEKALLDKEARAAQPVALPPPLPARKRAPPRDRDSAHVAEEQPAKLQAPSKQQRRGLPARECLKAETAATRTPVTPEPVTTFDVGTHVRFAGPKLAKNKKGVFVVEALKMPAGEHKLRSISSRELLPRIAGKLLKRCATHHGAFGKRGDKEKPKADYDEMLRRAGREAVERGFPEVSESSWEEAPQMLKPQPAGESVGRHDLTPRPHDPTRPGDAKCGGSLLLPTLLIGATGGEEDHGRLNKMPVLVLNYGAEVKFKGSLQHATLENAPKTAEHPRVGSHPSIVVQTADTLLGLTDRRGVDADLWRCATRDVLAKDSHWKDAAFIPVTRQPAPKGVENNVRFKESSDVQGEAMAYIAEKRAVLYDAITGEVLVLYEADGSVALQIASVITEHLAPLAKMHGITIVGERHVWQPPLESDADYPPSERLSFNAARSEGALAADDQRMQFIGSHSERTNSARRGSAPDGGTYGRRLVNSDDTADLTHYADTLRAPNFWYFSMMEARRCTRPAPARDSRLPRPMRRFAHALALRGVQPLFERLSQAYHRSSPRVAAYMVGVLARVDVRSRSGSDVGTFLSKDRLVSFCAPTSAYNSGIHRDVHDVGWTLAVAGKCRPPSAPRYECRCDPRGCEAALFDPTATSRAWSEVNGRLSAGELAGIRTSNDIQSAGGRLWFGAGRRRPAVCAPC